MGCCQSSPEERVQNNNNIINNSRSDNSNNTNGVPVASIVVTKAPSDTFENTAEPSHVIESPPPSIGEPLNDTTEPEKVPMTMTETDQSTLKSDIPAIATTKAPVPPAAAIQKEPKLLKKEQEEQGGPWSVIVRLSNTGKDITIPIPTEPPYMKISELRQQIQLNPDQQVKLIHLGHILKDQSMLIPSTNLTNSSDDTVQVSNQGVIQAMVYKPSI